MLTGPVLAAAWLLAVAGFAKLARPQGTERALREAALPHRSFLVQSLGLGELCLAVAVLVWATWPAVALLACAYLAFAAFSLRLLVRRGDSASCGCFGSTASPVHWVHAATNLAIAVACALSVAVWPAEPLGQAPVLVVMASMVLAGGLYCLLVALPPVLIETSRVITRTPAETGT